MKKQFKISKKTLRLLFLLLIIFSIFLSFTVIRNEKNNSTIKSGCTGDCAYFKAQINATYQNATGDKCAAVVQTVNGIISGQCGCPGHPFDPCNLRQYAINTFPCHFTMSSFISRCP